MLLQLSGFLQGQDDGRDQEQMQNDTGKGGDEGAGNEGLPGVAAAQQQKHGNAKGHAANEHSPRQGAVDTGDAVRQETVEQPRTQAVGRQLKGHGCGHGKQGRGAEEQ